MVKRECVLTTKLQKNCQVAELVRRNQWESNQQQLVYAGSNPVLTTSYFREVQDSYTERLPSMMNP